MHLGGLGDDLVSKYWKWRDQAHKNLNKGKIVVSFGSPKGKEDIEKLDEYIP